MNVQKPSRELSIRDTLSYTFNIYFKNFKTLFIAMLVAHLVIGVSGILLSAYGPSIPIPPIGATPEELQNWFSTYIAGMFVFAFTMSILEWIIYSVAIGVCVKFTSDLMEKGSTNLRNAFNFAVGKLFSLLMVAIIVGILVLLGSIALVIPGIILSIMFSLVVPAIIIEDVGTINSLSRSRRLVSHRWLKTFMFLLIIVIIVGGLSYIESLIVPPFRSLGWVSLVTAIIKGFIEPIVPIVLTVHYYSMLAKEKLSLPPSAPHPGTVVYCSYCGTANPWDSKFCGSCGAEIER